MSEKVAEIIETIEKADELFKALGPVRVEARTLWEEGIERLASAIWVYEKEADRPDKTP